MKKIHLFILRSYLGPFIVTFFVALFILVMQFFWKYIDDLMGKGLDASVIGEIFFYATANLIPMAMPLAILLSSIMTFGNIAESNELVAMKSSGMSLFKVMRPLVVFMIFVALGSYGFSNYLWPAANIKVRILVTDVGRKKPTMNVKEKIFYSDIDGISIRVNKKDKETNELFDIKIYDFSAGSANYQKRIWAEKGVMERTQDERFLVMNLENGNFYEEISPTAMKDSKHAFQKTTFGDALIKIDMSSLQLEKTGHHLYKDLVEILNMEELEAVVDSLGNRSLKIDSNYREINASMVATLRDTFSEVAMTEEDWGMKDSIQSKLKLYPNQAILNALSVVKHQRSTNEVRITQQLEVYNRTIDRANLEWHRRLVLSAAVLILFFIGAPLGAITKKGGIGLPVVLAIVLFIFYYILSISGINMAKSGALTPFFGVWGSVMVLVPISAFLTYKAAKESNLFEKSYYLKVLKIFKKKSE